jgi:nucleotide-binding universal stress UspA family protein
MFKNVLVGVDGRPNGRDAIALASQLTDPDGNLTLAHVHSGKLRPSHAITPGMVAEEREASHNLLEQERAAADVTADLLSIESMGPGRALHEQAEEQNADLLVVGSCSHGVFGRVMLGDDTRAALNGAPCAVAVAPRGYAERAGGADSQIDKVGVGYNASPESKVALALARKLAAQTGASVHALEVVWIPSATFTGIMPPAIGESIDVMLQQAKSRMEALPDVEGYAVYGLTGEELAVFGNAVDILIVGSRGYGPLRHHVLGSTCAYLERHARCPLLVLPRGATSAGEDCTTSSVLHADIPAATAV